MINVLYRRPQVQREEVDNAVMRGEGRRDLSGVETIQWRRKSGDLIELLVGDEEIDAGDVHVHDAAGADVEVADFAVAHLAFGEADGGAGGLDQGVGESAQEFVVSGLRARATALPLVSARKPSHRGR